VYDQAQTVTRRSLALSPLTAALACAAALASSCQQPAAAKEAGAIGGGAGTAAAAQIVTLPELKTALRGHKGRVVVLHLWATWCMPCLEELPLVAKFAREMRPRGVDVVSFSLDNASDVNAQKVAKLIGERAEGVLDRRIVRIDDPDAFITAIDPRWEGTIPALFVFDRAGALKRSLIGESSREQLEAAVTSLLDGTRR
jgi:thiol-disulfide isomerase/thioredoxin